MLKKLVICGTKGGQVMPVALEEAVMYCYFAYARQVVQVTEAMYPKLPEIYQDLYPLRITSQRLRQLGFDPIPGTDFNRFVKAYNGISLYLKAVKPDRWIVQIGSIEKLRYIDAIHQLQLLWLALFEEPLLRPKDKPKPILEPSHVITLPREKSRKGTGWMQNELSEVVPVPVQPFYLTWDCLFVLGTKPFAVWQVVDENAFFEYGGKSWGLKFLFGEASNLDDHRAADWLKTYARTIPHFS